MIERDTHALGIHLAPGVGVLDRFERALRDAGMHVMEHRQATSADVVDLGSAWAKRLGIPARRPACLLTARV